MSGETKPGITVTQGPSSRVDSVSVISLCHADDVSPQTDANLGDKATCWYSTEV